MRVRTRQKAISGLNITHEQFVDLCILLGCDYCDTIRGVGPKTALKLIREHKSIERIVQNIDTKKFTVPDSWLPKSSEKEKPATKVEDDAASSQDEESPPDVRPVNTSTEDDEDDDDIDDEAFVPAYVQARELFLNHEVVNKQSTEPKLNDVLKWKPCQAEELSTFLIDTMGFNRDRVTSSIAKLQAAYTKNLQPQSRLDSFFKPTVSSINKKRTLQPNDNNSKNAKKVKGTTAKAMGKRR